MSCLPLIWLTVRGLCEVYNCIKGVHKNDTGFPQLLETLEKPGIYILASWTLEIPWNFVSKPWLCLKFVKDIKHRSTQNFFFSLSKFHTVPSSTVFYENYWYLLRMLLRPKHFLNKLEKSLEILYTNNKVTTVFQKYLWKCAVYPWITIEIPLNFLIWDVWEHWW